MKLPGLMENRLPENIDTPPYWWYTISIEKQAYQAYRGGKMENS